MSTRKSPFLPRPPRQVSATARVLEELQLHGYHPGADEPDPRPLPETAALDNGVAALFDVFDGMLADTRLEPDLPDLLWNLADLFHRKAARVERALDDNEDRQRAAQKLQDGSEIRSVELEKLIAGGLSLIERRNAFEILRDRAGDHYEAHTGSAWLPRSGSLVSRKPMTAALIDSRDFIAARRRAETELLVPAGTKIVFAGGAKCNDHIAIWAALDRIHAKYPDMVLLHGGQKLGAERIAQAWALNRKVPQVPFAPDFNRHKLAAPFKRNDLLLEEMPKGVIVFSGNGITDNLADKAKKLGIPVQDFRKRDGG